MPVNWVVVVTAPPIITEAIPSLPPAPVVAPAPNPIVPL